MHTHTHTRMTSVFQNLPDDWDCRVRSYRGGLESASALCYPCPRLVTTFLLEWWVSDSAQLTCPHYQFSRWSTETIFGSRVSRPRQTGNRERRNGERRNRERPRPWRNRERRNGVRLRPRSTSMRSSLKIAIVSPSRPAPSAWSFQRPCT
jgi:hypothetical protein